LGSAKKGGTHRTESLRKRKPPRGRKKAHKKGRYCGCKSKIANVGKGFEGTTEPRTGMHSEFGRRSSNGMWSRT